ncbi:SMP-30/gluconolactonase/LRE family protein [Opitutus terrae]|uniref:SMP-30/Gluconolaconase/LRE domain protein n=1 Tax=Opitutus terrae (strain DSM 11246 / JCM 15787 / PB90-1) TaxID=452637 RepID=B1ZXP6_OPITP|nr:SMP-30/gluconolaconase/LRE domain-containing protein [Opitutus terrae]ACB74268.1 SMP-30/Gluconolaconase/LRE domain protein [Opitutus terrae PB90-1]
MLLQPRLSFLPRLTAMALLVTMLATLGARTRAESQVPFVAPDTVPGLVIDWSLSPTLRPSALGPERYLEGKAAAAIEWLPVRSDAAGLVELTRFRTPNAQGGSKIWARALVTAERREVRPFALRFRGDLGVYLNGQKLFHGQRDGAANEKPDTLYLSLEAGDNELVLMATEQSGGWSFTVRDQSAIFRAPQLAPVWEHQGRLPAPESVAHDPKRGMLYVSNFAGNSIAKLAMNGDVLARDWVKDVDRPTGLKLHGGRLYVVARGAIVEIDPETGMVVTRTPIAGAVFPNDLAIDADGAIYVTDTFKNCIHRLAAGRSEVWLEGPAVAQPNGILVERARLLVGVTADAAIRAVDLATKAVTTLVTVSRPANMDGLTSDGAGGYLFSDYFGRLYHVDAAGRPMLLLDRRGPRQFCADFEYVPSERLIIIPSLYDDRVTAYHWGPASN